MTKTYFISIPVYYVEHGLINEYLNEELARLIKNDGYLLKKIIYFNYPYQKGIGDFEIKVEVEPIKSNNIEKFSVLWD